MADNKMMIFENNTFGSIRTVVMDDGVWFVGKEVAAILGYERTTKAVTDHVDEDDRLMLNRKTQSQFGIELGQRGGWLVSESGLYSLILSSKLPTARTFKRWVTAEILPSIRRHGAYMTDAVITHLEENPELVPEYLNHLRDENARTKEIRRQLDTVTGQLAIAQPKADYYNAYVNNEDALCFRYVAKELGVSERKLINYLLDKRFLYRDAHRDSRVFPRAGDRNDPLFLVRDFHTRSGHRGQYTVLTVAGREYLMRRVGEISTYVPEKNRDIVPEICPISAETV
jgi:prophage antirepressor-like protein